MKTKGNKTKPIIYNKDEYIQNTRLILRGGKGNTIVQVQFSTRTFIIENREIYSVESV